MTDDMAEQIGIAIFAVLYSFPIGYGMYLLDAPHWATYGLSMIIFNIVNFNVRYGRKIK